jgi:hypothetical protein
MSNKPPQNCPGCYRLAFKLAIICAAQIALIAPILNDFCSEYPLPLIQQPITSGAALPPLNKAHICHQSSSAAIQVRFLQLHLPRIH